MLWTIKNQCRIFPASLPFLAEATVTDSIDLPHFLLAFPRRVNIPVLLSGITTKGLTHNKSALII